MISILHLLWLVPVVFLAGVAMAALFAAGDNGDINHEEHRKGGHKK